MSLEDMSCSFPGCERDVADGERLCVFHVAMLDAIEVEPHRMVPLAVGGDGRAHWDGFNQIHRKGRNAKDDGFKPVPDPQHNAGWEMRPAYRKRAIGAKWIGLLEAALRERGTTISDFKGLAPAEFAKQLRTHLCISHRTCRWRWAVSVRNRRNTVGQIEPVVVVEYAGEWALIDAV